jgi:rRNA maturation protein Nop10
MTSNCLNCGKTTSENYCPNCGQKTDTHRYSFKHLIEHDFIHGIWHVDKGILYTLKELFTRPGHRVREYIQGKRKGLFNFFTLLVIILAVSHFIGQYSNVKVFDLFSESAKSTTDILNEYSKKYPKLFVLINIPFNAIFSFLWFKKAKLNFTEHLVLNAYATVFNAVIGLLFVIISVFYTNLNGLRIIYGLIGFTQLLYAFWVYYQFFSEYNFSKKGLIIRSIGTIFSAMFLSVLIGIVWKILENVIK